MTEEDDEPYEMGEGSEDVVSLLPTNEKVGHYFSLYCQSPISHMQLNAASDKGWTMTQILPYIMKRSLGYIIYFRYDGLMN